MYHGYQKSYNINMCNLFMKSYIQSGNLVKAYYATENRGLISDRSKRGLHSYWRERGGGGGGGGWEVSRGLVQLRFAGLPCQGRQT